MLFALLVFLTGCSREAPAETSGSQSTAAETVETTEQTEAPTEQTTAPTEATLPEPTIAETEPQKTDTPATQKPASSSKPSTSQPKPSKPNSGRPTSSATCKDTGSNEIWPDPRPQTMGMYEETDPNRPEYLQYLRQYAPAYSFFFEEEELQMYLGHSYGMPFITEYEMITKCSWSVSDPSVATVNELGFVVPLKEGKTTVTVAYSGADAALTNQCTITIVKEPAPPTYAYLEARAKEEAKLIADNVMKDPKLKTDLERIAKAARLVNAYVGNGTSTSLVPGYNQPFGTLVTFYSSCAGSTRAMGLVLEYMGFEWYHVNEGQWGHQWCTVYDVDGKTAFADGSEYGIAGYGERLDDRSNWVQYKNDTLLVQPY